MAEYQKVEVVKDTSQPYSEDDLQKIQESEQSQDDGTGS